MRFTPLERNREAERRNYERLTNWHRHFAILPTWVADGDCRWLEWVERKLTFYGGSYGNSFIGAEYRAAPPLSAEKQT